MLNPFVIDINEIIIGVDRNEKATHIDNDDYGIKWLFDDRRDIQRATCDEN